MGGGKISTKTMCICIRWFLHTRNNVLSTKLIPVYFPIQHLFTKSMNPLLWFP